MLFKPLLALAASALFASANGQNIVDTLVANAGDRNLSTILSVVENYPNILSALGTNGLTVFLPTNAALEGLDLSNEPVEEILKYHVATTSSPKNAADFSTYQIESTLLKNSSLVKFDGAQKLVVEKKDGNVLINCDRVGKCIQVVDTIVADNGIIHAVDSLIFPPTDLVSTLSSFKPYNLSSLIGAVVGTNLTNTLVNAKGITVFAPTNEAFAKVSANLTTAQVADILKYHVVPSVVYSTELIDGAKVETLEGSKLTITLSNGAKVNGVKILFTELLSDNGVVHVIDTVLNPEDNPVKTSGAFKLGNVNAAMVMVIAVSSLLALAF